MSALELIEQDKAAPPVAVAPQHQLTAVEHAIRAGATPEQLERVLELQVRADNHKLEMMREKRRMDEEDRKAAAARAFDAAMTKLRKHNVIIPKTKEVVQTARGGGPGPRFKQSEFDVVCSRLSPALHDCGLSFRHDMRFDTRPWKADGSNPAIPAGTEITIPWVFVTCYLTHSDGHTETLTLEGPPDSSGSKNPLQEMQSTASYLKRQSLLAITGTATGGEDDENNLRSKAGAAERDDGDADAREALVNAGRQAALSGMAELNKWWASLTPRQQKDMGQDFGPMRKAARAADEGVQR